MRCYDVVVVGAGPAGSLAAYHLAVAGASVLLVDRARFPRDKPCGGGLTARAVRALPFSPSPVVEQEVDRLLVRLNYSRCFERRSRAPLVFMTRRIRLDEFLVQQAVAAGAQFVDGARATAICPRDASVSFGRRIVRASVVVGADGANGISARSIGVERTYGVAIEGRLPYQLIADTDLRRAAMIEIAGIVGGYGWLFPKADHVNVGVGGAPQEGRHLRRHLLALCAAHGVRPDQLEGLRGFRLPVRAPNAVAARERVVVVGDAAGLIDPVSGDGMYEAFVSARLAARAALASLGGGAAALTAYPGELERALGPLHALSWDVKLALERFPRLTLALAQSAAGWQELEEIVGGARADARVASRVGIPIRALALLARLTGDSAAPWRLAPRAWLRSRGLDPATGAGDRPRGVDADEQHRRDERRIGVRARAAPVDVAAEANQRDDVEDPQAEVADGRRAHARPVVLEQRVHAGDAEPEQPGADGPSGQWRQVPRP